MNYGSPQPTQALAGCFNSHQGVSAEGSVTDLKATNLRRDTLCSKDHSLAAPEPKLIGILVIMSQAKHFLTVLRKVGGRLKLRSHSHSKE